MAVGYHKKRFFVLKKRCYYVIVIMNNNNVSAEDIAKQNLKMIYDDKNGLGYNNSGYCHAFTNFTFFMSNPIFIKCIQEFKKNQLCIDMNNLFSKYDSIENCTNLLQLNNSVWQFAPSLYVLFCKLYGYWVNDTRQLDMKSRNNVIHVLKFIKLICDNTDKDGALIKKTGKSTAYDPGGLFIQSNRNIYEGIIKLINQQKNKDNNNFYNHPAFMNAFLLHCALIMCNGDFNKIPLSTFDSITLFQANHDHIKDIRDSNYNEQIKKLLNDGKVIHVATWGNHMYVVFKDNGRYYAVGSNKNGYNTPEEAIGAWEPHFSEGETAGLVTVRPNEICWNKASVHDVCKEICNTFLSGFNEIGETPLQLTQNNKINWIPRLQPYILKNMKYLYEDCLPLVLMDLQANDNIKQALIKQINNVCCGQSPNDAQKIINNVLNSLPGLKAPQTNQMNNIGMNMGNPMVMNCQNGMNNMNNQNMHNINNNMNMNINMNMVNNVQNPMMNNMGNNNMGMNNNINVNNINNNMNNQINQNGMNNMNNPMMNNIGMNMGNNIMNNQMGMKPQFIPPNNMNNPIGMNGQNGMNNMGNNNMNNNVQPPQNPITNISQNIATAQLKPSDLQNASNKNISSPQNQLYDSSINDLNNNTKYLLGLSCLPEISKDTSDCGTLFYWESCC